MQSLLIKTSHRYELRDKITYVVPKPNTEYLPKNPYHIKLLLFGTQLIKNLSQQTL